MTDGCLADSEKTHDGRGRIRAPSDRQVKAPSSSCTTIDERDVFGSRAAAHSARPGRLARNSGALQNACERETGRSADHAFYSSTTQSARQTSTSATFLASPSLSSTGSPAWVTAFIMIGPPGSAQTRISSSPSGVELHGRPCPRHHLDSSGRSAVSDPRCMARPGRPRCVRWRSRRRVGDAPIARAACSAPATPSRQNVVSAERQFRAPFGNRRHSPIGYAGCGWLGRRSRGGYLAVVCVPTGWAVPSNLTRELCL